METPNQTSRIVRPALAMTLLLIAGFSGLGCGKKEDLAQNVGTRLSFSALQYSEPSKNTTPQASQTPFSDPNASPSYDLGTNLPDEASALANGGWAHLDGLRIYLTHVGIDGDSAHSELFSHSGFPLELKGEATHLSLPQTLGVQPGHYDRFQFEVQSQFELKAWARTENSTCYTRAHEIACVEGLVLPEAFTDYDYFHYDYIYVTTAHGLHDPGGSGHFEGRISGGLDVRVGSAPLSLQVVIDTYRILTFWNGEGSRPALAPFFWSNNDGIPTSVFYPEGQANFGLSYIPFFLSVSNRGDTDSVGQIYAISTHSGTLSGFESNSYNLRGIQYMTVLFKNTGEYSESRVFGFDQGVLWQFNGLFTPADNGTYQFSNGEFNSATGQNYQDRVVSGFKVAELGETFETLLTDGPECGINQRTRDCLRTTQAVYFKRVK